MDCQAEAPDETHQLQVIAQRQLRVEAALEQNPAAAVVVKFYSLAASASQSRT